jgi:hypothetical protein
MQPWTFLAFAIIIFGFQTYFNNLCVIDRSSLPKPVPHRRRDYPFEKKESGTSIQNNPSQLPGLGILFFTIPTDCLEGGNENDGT